MATQDVPGANPANADELRVGNWAEHEDGSMLYVQGTENGQVVFQLYDLAQDPPVYYQDAMREEAFKKAFSHPPIGTSSDKWTWHDKTPMPWHRVMKTFDKPAPMHADVHDTLSAAARVAQSLRLRSQRLAASEVEHLSEKQTPKGRGIIDRIQRALDAFVEG